MAPIRTLDLAMNELLRRRLAEVEEQIALARRRLAAVQEYDEAALQAVGVDLAEVIKRGLVRS